VAKEKASYTAEPMSSLLPTCSVLGVVLVLGAGSSAACGARPGRPSLAPPEYEDPVAAETETVPTPPADGGAPPVAR
jgi:hypothetical protein